MIPIYFQVKCSKVKVKLLFWAHCVVHFRYFNPLVTCFVQVLLLQGRLTWILHHGGHRCFWNISCSLPYENSKSTFYKEQNIKRITLMIWFLTTMVNSAKNCYHFSSWENVAISDFWKFWYIWEQLSGCKIRRGGFIIAAIVSAIWMFLLYSHIKLNAYPVNMGIVLLYSVFFQTSCLWRKYYWGRSKIILEALYRRGILFYSSFKQDKIILLFHCSGSLQRHSVLIFLWLTGDLALNLCVCFTGDEPILCVPDSQYYLVAVWQLLLLCCLHSLHISSVRWNFTVWNQESEYA